MFETNQIIVCEDPFFGEVFGRTPHRWRTSSANIAARGVRFVRSGASQRRSRNERHGHWFQIQIRSKYHLVI